MKKIAIYATVILAIVISACSGSKGWKVEGSMSNAPEGAKVAVEGFNGVMWYNIDSVAVGSNGKFSYASPEGSVRPDVYRLSYNGRSIYFPIDSLEGVTVECDASSFDKGYVLSGSKLAQSMMEVDQLIAQGVDSIGKNQLNNIVLADSVGVISYYLINKTINGKPLYNSSDRRDLAIIGAVANKFDILRPNDSRTAFLKQRFIEGRRQHGIIPTAGGPTIEAREVELFDINLYDQRGKMQSLASLAQTSPVVVLSFTAYDVENSLPYNVELNKAYEKYRNKGFQIYQVAIGDNEVEWRNAAANLPWIAVRANGKEGNDAFINYNVGAVPTTFIIKDGVLQERVEDNAKIASVIAKYM